MSVLFVNACAREGSRTERLARAWIEREGIEVTDEVDVMDRCIEPFTKANIDIYGAGVATGDYSDPIFDYARQFAQATDIIMAAPLWNMALPSRLHDYLELVCAQGVTFDVGEVSGSYVSLIAAQSLTVISTCGGPWPEPADDHVFGYIQTLSDYFWHIPHLRFIRADGIDIVGTDVEDVLQRALERSR